MPWTPVVLGVISAALAQGAFDANEACAFGVLLAATAWNFFCAACVMAERRPS